MTTTIEIFKYEKNVAEYAEGDVVFSVGDAGDLMYVVQSGDIEVSLNGRVLDTLGPGGVFGEMTARRSSRCRSCAS
jgi:CRP-like cAMP-binding protein